MDIIKIKNFHKSYPGVDFPKFESLDNEHCAAIRSRLCKKLGLVLDAAALDVTKALYLQSAQILCNVPNSGNIDLKALLKDVGVKPNSLLFLNWYRFDVIDALCIDDLAKYFDDIWYPASDDLDIFDDSLEWILSVSHDGKLTFRSQ